MKRTEKTLFKPQQGAAVLVTTIILLIAVTLVVIYASRVGVLDQRISANEYRHKVAFANAEAGLEQAASFLRANPVLHDGNVVDGWATCTGSTSIFPCDITGATQVFATVNVGVSITSLVSTTTSSNGSAGAFLVKTTDGGTTAVGEGVSDDGTGAAIAQVTYAKTSLLTPGPVPPLMVPTGTLSGNFNIVPNPNGGGPGVPLSVWAKDTLDTTGANWKTCDHGEFKDSGSVCIDSKGDGDSGTDWLACSCDEERSNTTDVNEDIVLYPDADFPNSPFAYVFGADGEDIDGDGDVDADDITTLKADIKARAAATGLVLADCSALETEFNALARPALVWVTGDCQPGSNLTVGSRARPIILVVEGELRLSANSEYWGVLVSLDDFVLNGGPVIHGSAISDQDSDLTNGTYNQVYDEDVFSNLRDDTINTDIAKVAYSWRDFTPN